MVAASGVAPYEAIETASRDEISALQAERLRCSLRQAYDNVDHYRRKFDEHGVHADDLKTLADLSKFPFTTKADLRENYPFKMFAVAREQVVRVHASSGTTGQPTVVGHTQNDIDMWATLMARSMRRIDKITGRSDDMLVIRGGNVFPSQIEELILKQPMLSPHYLIEVWRDGHLDAVDVNVEIKREYRYRLAVDKEHVAHALQHHIKSFIGITAHVRIVDIGGIERSLGKALRVIAKRRCE